jgi:hypothetical protein
MKKIIGIGLIMLSFYLCNSHSSIATPQKVVKNTQFTASNDTDSKITADISSRDDQSKDCLRKRRCTS